MSHVRPRSSQEERHVFSARLQADFVPDFKPLAYDAAASRITVNYSNPQVVSLNESLVVIHRKFSHGVLRFNNCRCAAIMTSSYDMTMHRVTQLRFDPTAAAFASRASRCWPAAASAYLVSL